MSKPDGGPAFASVTSVTDWEAHRRAGGGAGGGDGTATHTIRTTGGMTLRDYFAAAALPIVQDSSVKHRVSVDALEMAELAYVLADAMLAEREKP